MPTATNPDIVLGVELEFLVINDPDAKESYTSQWPVIKSYPKDQKWTNCTHHGHGKLVQSIEESTGGFIRVGYDLTVAPEPHGFECYSQPGTFMDQLQAWTAFWDGPIVDHMSVGVTGNTQFGNPKSCGMHVHLSGKLLTPITMANMLVFINNRANAQFLTYVADRYDGHYAKIADSMTFDHAQFLYHSDDCQKWKKKKILNAHKDTGGAQLYATPTGLYGTKYCCENYSKYSELCNAGVFIRGALYPTPTDGTGDCEFRLFATPTCSSRFFANLEFVHALAAYGHLTGPREAGYNAFCEWLMADAVRRVRYRNLFKWLREANYVEGLIPRRKKVGGSTG